MVTMLVHMAILMCPLLYISYQILIHYISIFLYVLTFMTLHLYYVLGVHAQD